MTAGERHDALAAGVRLFNAGEYYEAHEAWERQWQLMGGSRAGFWKGLIQAAVALLHWERGNHHGARKLHRSARGCLEPFRPRCEGVEVGVLLDDLAACFAPLEAAARDGRPSPGPGPERPQIVLAD